MKWRSRETVSDRPMGPTNPCSTVLSTEQEELCVAFRKHTLLPLDDCLDALQATIPNLTRSSLHSLFQRHGISRLPTLDSDKPKKRFKDYAIGYFHMFDRVCRENGIEHRLTKPNHPCTNGQVERMNRTLKGATIRRYHYDTHDQLRAHLHAFVQADNFAKRLKMLCGFTPYEAIVKCSTNEPNRFILNPNHHMSGPKS